MAHYLVTGVAGFIGSAIASRLLADGHAVTGLDNLSTGREQSVPAGITFVTGNCHDASTYEKLENTSFDAILHLAGQSSAEASFDDPLLGLSACSQSTLRLLEFARKNNCRRFIFSSSMWVYGDKFHTPVSEEIACNPLSFFGLSKLEGEHCVRLYRHYGIEGTALRLFSVYGPGQDMSRKRKGMVSIYMSMMQQEGHITIKGSPNRFRDFVYIDDAVEAFVLCLKHQQSIGQIINVGSGNKTTVGQLVEELRKISKIPTTLEYAGSTVGDVQGVCADISSAAKYLHYDPAVSLPQGLQKMYDWYVQQSV